MGSSTLEQQFLKIWNDAKLDMPEPLSEYRFDPTRKWRFDFAWPAVKVAVEIEGGIWSRGRHATGPGLEKDMDKYNAATAAGWKVLRFAPKHFRDPHELVQTILVAMGALS